MAWTSDSHDGTAGAFIDLLDTLLVAAHTTWSVYDSGFAANEKVYRCYDPDADPVVDFYLHVLDNQLDYAIVLMYDSWDNVGHSYAHDTGLKVIYGATAPNVPYICKEPGGHYFSSHDHRFIYINKVGWLANYVGMLEYPSTFQRPKIQHPVVIVSSTLYATGYNPLGRVGNFSAYIVSRAMMGARGEGMSEVRQWGATSGWRYWICADGGVHLRPTWIYEAVTTDLIGRLRNVAIGYTNAPFDNDDTVTIGGDVWRYVEGTYSTRYSCFIKQE